MLHEVLQSQPVRNRHRPARPQQAPTHTPLKTGCSGESWARQNEALSGK